MSEDQEKLKGPDLSVGVPASSIPDGGLLLGHAGGKAVLLARHGEEIFAIGATCTHYSGPLAEGLIVGDTVRCPWHHACFSLRTGEALRAPAHNPVSRWELERRGDTIVVTNEVKAPDGATPIIDADAESAAASTSDIHRIVIIGAGASGYSGAEMLRREGFGGTITIVGADPHAPYDRPNLSKDYLAGTAQEEWLPLRSAGFYKRHDIELRTSCSATAIDTKAKRVTLSNGDTLEYDRLLLCTGATPVTLKVPGADLPHVFYLRSLDDSRHIIEAAKSAKSAVVIGASFIGLEAAAALRERTLDVHVVAPDAVPLEKVFGRELGAHIKSLHDQHGVQFSLGRSLTSIGASSVTLDDGSTIFADLVLVGIGVKPNIDLAKSCGLAVDNGVVVNAFLESSARDVYAAGDIASFPYREMGNIRVEHWVVAERMGQTAARNMLGAREHFDAIPFFWSAHFGTSVRYVGHANNFESATVSGDLASGEATVTYVEKGKAVAFATLKRDVAALEAERAFEANDDLALKRIAAAK